MSLAVTLFKMAQRSGIPFGCRVASRDVRALNASYSWHRYEIMKRDTVRNRAYREAIGRVVRGKVVVELGTGPHAVLALQCVDAGAKKVYAIEANPRGADLARRLVAKQGAGRIVRVLDGYSTEVELEEPGDVLVQDIVGSIASSEGCLRAVDDTLKRMMHSDPALIPQRATTWMAPVRPLCWTSWSRLLGVLGGGLVRTPGVGRHHIVNFPRSRLVAEPQVFEDLPFGEALRLVADRELVFTTGADCCLDGFLFYVTVVVDRGCELNALTQRTNWPVLYLKMLDVPARLKAGAAIRVRTHRDTATDLPAYRVQADFLDQRLGKEAHVEHRWAGC